MRFLKETHNFIPVPSFIGKAAVGHPAGSTRLPISFDGIDHIGI
jgi:hypothetical protein